MNSKKLVAGDAVLFLRGKDGVLRLGIRRVSCFPVTSGDSSRLLSDFSFSSVVKSVTQKTIFNVCFNPRYFRFCGSFLWHYQVIKSYNVLMC